MVRMDIAKYTPQSTTGWKGRVTFVVYTPGCNMRCGFCTSPLLGSTPNITIRTIEEELRKVALGVKSVVITGGEPCLQDGLPIFCKRLKLKKLGVKLETNGSFPDMLKTLITRRVVDYIALDVKAPLDAARYEEITKSKLLPQVKESIALLMKTKVDHEFRTTWSPDLSADEIIQIGKQLTGCKRFVLQQFIPGSTIDPAYSNKPKTDYELLKKTAESIVGPKEVIIRSEERGEERIR